MHATCMQHACKIHAACIECTCVCHTEEQDWKWDRVGVSEPELAVQKEFREADDGDDGDDGMDDSLKSFRMAFARAKARARKRQTKAVQNDCRSASRSELSSSHDCRSRVGLLAVQSCASDVQVLVHMK